MKFEFVQPFDGSQPEVSMSEQHEVSRAFVSFFDDLMLNNIEHLRTIDASKDKTDPNTYLALGSTSYEGVKVSVNLTDKPNGQEFLKQIHLQAFEANGVTGSDAVAYRLGVDGIVRRVDLPKKTQEQKDMDFAAGVREIREEDNVSPLEGLAISEGMLAALRESVKDQKLAREMGYNDQPIGLDEWQETQRLIGSVA